MNLFNLTQLEIIDLVSLVGMRLYGEKWQIRLSTDLKIDRKRLRSWLKQERDFPENIPKDLLSILLIKSETISTLVDLANDRYSQVLGLTRLELNLEEDSILFERIGRELFGAWLISIAQVLSVEDRTAKGWAYAKKAIPAGVWLELIEILKAKKITVDELIVFLKK